MDRRETREVRVTLQNHTGKNFKFQVLHQYSHDPIDDSGWHIFKPNEEKEMLKNVEYRTGYLTFGRDYWIVRGKLLSVHENSQIGRMFVEEMSYRTLPNPLWSWKMHTLREIDDGKEVMINVTPTDVHIISPSGTSTTRFDAY